MSSSLNIAVIGLGSHARRNALPALNHIDGINIAGVLTRNEEVARTVAEQYQCKVYIDMDELVSDKAIDVVYIALPAGLHADWGLEIVSAGKHLWCEKPLTHDLARTSEILERAKTRQVAVCECFMYQFHPQFIRLKQLIDDGRVGEIRSLVGRFCFPHRQQDDIRYSAELGGGALLDAGCYLVHSARLLLGETPGRVYSRTSTEAGYEVDTSGFAVLEYEDGANAWLHWGFGISYMNELEILGETGRIRVERSFSKPPDYLSRIEIRDTDGSEEIVEVSPANHFTEMFLTFIRTCHDENLRNLYYTDAQSQASFMQKLISPGQ